VITFRPAKRCAQLSNLELDQAVIRKQAEIRQLEVQLLKELSNNR
jgi:hypothetical protein